MQRRERVIIFKFFFIFFYFSILIMNLNNYLIISLLYIALAYISFQELQLYKSSETDKVKDKFRYKPIKITIYLAIGLIYLLSYLK